MRIINWLIMALMALVLFTACERDTSGGSADSDEAAASVAAALDTESPEADKSDPVAEPAEDDPAEAIDADEVVDAEQAEELLAEETETAAEPVAAEGTTLVVLETTVGDITVEVHPDWAPIGAEHFLMLVDEGYYDGAPFFRVMPGFMAQCGFSGDHELTSEFLGNSIQDDPVIMGNYKYTMSFGNRGAANTRSTHVFINFADNNMLDTQRAPFPAFAKVIAGFDAVENIYRTGEMPSQVQQRMSEPGGAEWFVEQYPDATVITKAYVKE